MKMVPAGITGILCVFGDTISESTGELVSAFAAAVRRAQPAGLVELIPSYASLLVRYDPLLTDFGTLSAALERLANTRAAEQDSTPAVIELPVCYGGTYGPDLAFVAAHAHLSEEEVIRIHSGTAYRIYMLGFLPGFPYLGGLDERLHTPRLDTPRTAIPAGSVGIGGKQTGVYPMESPGGWQLIGRTPVRLFDPGRPLPYHAGDLIRFVPISEAEYLRKEAESWRSA